MKVHICPKCKSVIEDNLPNNLCPVCKIPLEDRERIHLWQINASLVKQKVIARTLIAGESNPKAIYTKYLTHCEKCDEENIVDLESPDMRSALVEALTHCKEPKNAILEALPKLGCVDGKKHKKHVWRVEAQSPPKDYRRIWVRDILGMEDIPERSTIAKNYESFIFTTSPNFKKVRLDAEIHINPRNDDIFALILETTPIMNSIENFELSNEEMNELSELRNLKTLGDCLDRAEKWVAPLVKGRKEAKLTGWLTADSIMWFTVDGVTPVPGCLRSLNVGDPRTAKGMTARFWTEQIGIGEHCWGETSSRAGLTYYVDPESNTLIWGLLVQADLGLAVIEALHGLPPEELMQFREALVSQRIEVMKKVSGMAWARCRILADANTPKPMANYPYPIQALTNVSCFLDPIDLTRWDLFVPFDSRDVPPEDLKSVLEGVDQDEKARRILRHLALWAMSRRQNDIKFTPEALKTAKDKFVELFNKYHCDDIPIFHNASIWSILRIGASFAVTTFSTPDGKQVLVEDNHVKMACEFLRRLYDMWGLEDYIAAVEKPELTADETIEITKLLQEGDIPRSFLKEIQFKPWQSSDLAVKIGCDSSHLRRVASRMKALGLVVTKSKGYDLTVKGAEVVKRFIHQKNESERKTGTCCMKCGSMDSLSVVTWKGERRLMCRKCIDELGPEVKY